MLLLAVRSQDVVGSSEIGGGLGMSASPYEESMLHFDVRDEIKKFGLLLDDADFRGVLDTRYVQEKLAMILASTPISLDAKNRARFNRWKQGPARLQ